MSVVTGGRLGVAVHAGDLEADAVMVVNVNRDRAVRLRGPCG